MKKILLLFVFCQMLTGLSKNIFAQSPQSWSSADIQLALHKLNVLGSVLYIAAHPDDENTRLITYFSKDKLFRTGYLSLTRGDGGQNLIGDEQGIELGLIRTQELLAARRIDGGEQFFSRAFDFGYSKTPEETFTKWDKEKILSDVVWIIRKFQPDIIITRFPTTGEGGHGHHTGSAILANEAFTAAADPKRFPEQLQYVQVWQAKRILWNTFNFGGNNTITPDQFRVDVGGYNPLLGKSYGEIAAESRSQHKSQGFGVPASRGESFESFKTTGGPEPVKDLMDGVDLGWKRVAGGESIEKKVQELISSFDHQYPEKSVEGLVRLHQMISKLPDCYWKAQKSFEIHQLIVYCSGLFFDITTPEQFAVQTDSVRFNFSINNRLGIDAKLERISLIDYVTFDISLDTSFSRQLIGNKNFNFSKTLYVPTSKAITQPFWLKNKMEEGHYNVEDQQMIGYPDVYPSYLVLLQVRIVGEEFTFVRPVKYKFTDPVKGEVYRPLVVIPPVTLRINPELNIQLTGANYQKIYTSFANKNKIVVSTKNREKFIPPGRFEDSLVLSKNEVRIRDVDKTINGKHSSMNGVSDIEHYVYVHVDTFINKLNSENMHDMINIKYDHIPAITYFKTSSVTIKNYTYKREGEKIGYIIGAGDKVPEALEQMGYDVTLLTEKELSRNNLKQFDAIMAGVRAYNTNDWLSKYYDKLMQYVKDGGNYIVQYNTNNFISNIKNKIGPYDFSIARTRVTDENAAVNFLKPTHPVLNFPNKITQEDFKGWIQERSVYHASNWDKNFEPIFSMSDSGDKPDDGSLIIAKYGKGYFTYTGLVFFRELPAGVPGAYRLLANIIALNRPHSNIEN